jgi:hypothetical protein
MDDSPSKATTKATAAAPAATPIPAPAAVANRRRHERLEFSARVSIHELSSDDIPGDPQTAEAFDLSRSGIGLRTKRMFYVGTPVLIHIQLRTQRTYKRGVVRFSKYTSGGWHLCGVEFTNAPGTERLKGWIRKHLDAQ